MACRWWLGAIQLRRARQRRSTSRASATRRLDGEGRGWRLRHRRCSERDVEAELDRVVVAFEIILEGGRGCRRTELTVLPPGVLVFEKHRYLAAEALQEAR